MDRDRIGAHRSGGGVLVVMMLDRGGHGSGKDRGADGAGSGMLLAGSAGGQCQRDA